MPRRVNTNANEVIEGELFSHVQALEGAIDGDVLAIRGPLVFGMDDFVRDIVEKRMARRDKSASEDETISATLKVYYGLLVDYMGRLAHVAALHSDNRYVPVGVEPRQ